MIKRPNLERTPNYDLTFDLMGRQLAQKLREAVNSKGISATGNLANSFIYDENEGVVKFLKYGEIVDGGRRSGGFPPIRPIVEWINAKGISVGNKTDEQVAFAIAKTIEKRGYRPQPFIQPTISELEQRFAEYFAEAIADDIELNAQVYFDNNVNNKKFTINLGKKK